MVPVPRVPTPGAVAARLRSLRSAAISPQGGTLSERATQRRTPTAARRKYDSPLRRQRAAETRERIVTAGAELMHGLPIWNWSALTMQAVAEHAGVNVRTVYRHFRNERELKDEVLRRLQKEAGVRVDTGLRLEDVADLTTRVIEYASSFPLAPRTPRDPTVAAANVRQREALLAAVARATPGWSDADRSLAAGMLDVLWSPVSYERLAADWRLDPAHAVQGIRWVIELVEQAIRAGRAPSS